MSTSTSLVSTSMRLCDPEGKSVEYDSQPDIDSARETFQQDDAVPFFYLSGGDAPLDSFRDLPQDSEVYVVYKTAFADWIHESFPPVVADLFGGHAAMATLPKLEWNPGFLGSTHYIDGIRRADLGDNPVMVGEDNFRRPFVTFRLTRKSEKEDVNGKPMRVHHLHTLFQRYTDSPCTWAFAGCGIMCGSLHEDNQEIMRELFSEAGFRCQDCQWRAACVDEEPSCV